MRVSSLSDDRVIKLISRYFIPAWYSNDGYQIGPQAAKEKAEFTRIQQQRIRDKIRAGQVWVYMLDAKGRVFATMPVQQASHPDKLLPFLRSIIEDHKVGARTAKAIRDTTVRPAKLPAPATEGGRYFSIYTRGDASRGISHDRIELSAKQWSGFVPGPKARVGDYFTVPAEATRTLLQYSYPPLPHWKSEWGKIRSARLTATVASLSGSEARLQLEGRVELLYPYKGTPTDALATVQLVGTARVDTAGKKLTSLQMISEKGDYLWYWEGKPQPRKFVMGIEME